MRLVAVVALCRSPSDVFLRTLPPDAVARFADGHDEGLWRCMCRLLNIPEDQDEATKLSATMPWLWEDWGFGALPAPHKPLSGRVGRFASP